MSSTEALATTTWHVRIDLGDHGRETHAVAHLQTGSDTHLSGRGTARTSPADPVVPEIGEELAAARALSDLAHRLLDAAAGDLAAVLHERVRIEG